MLAAKVLTEAGISVTGICFKSNFFGCQRARLSARSLNIPLIEKDISAQVLATVKSPVCGYGKNLNPCIDCHALMIREASKYLKPQPKFDLLKALSFNHRKKIAGGKAIFDFIATGEVLGQRPFSQNFQALMKIKQMAGVEVLRPLSAAALPKTEIEKNGLIKRQKLLKIQGRSREIQMRLADKYGLKYPSPAGGCLLTDREGSNKILDIILRCPDCKPADVELLRYGRVFWLKTKIDGVGRKNNESLKTTLSLKSALKSLNLKHCKDIKVEAEINFHWVLAVVGRDKAESEKLEKLAKTGDIVVKLDKMTGPTTLVRLEEIKWKTKKWKTKIEIPEKLNFNDLEFDKIKAERQIFDAAGLLTGYYATKARGKKAYINFQIK